MTVFSACVECLERHGVADFDGGGLSSDLGPLLLRGVDQQIGLISRLAAAIDDRRHPSYIQRA